MLNEFENEKRQPEYNVEDKQQHTGNYSSSLSVLHPFLSLHERRGKVLPRDPLTLSSKKQQHSCIKSDHDNQRNEEKRNKVKQPVYSFLFLHKSEILFGCDDVDVQCPGEANKRCQANEPGQAKGCQHSSVPDDFIVSQSPHDVDKTIAGHHCDV